MLLRREGPVLTIDAYEASGGIPLRVVFDNPNTVVLGRDENGRPRC